MPRYRKAKLASGNDGMPEYMNAKHYGLGIVALAAIIFILSLQPFTQSVASDPEENTRINGPLDGLVFVGKLQSVDGSISLDDTLHFNEGHFWSSGCTKCSFMPGAYWTRTNGTATEFRGVLESPERGRFTYKGSVQDGNIEVKIHWLRERWYWTVDRDYEFSGKMDQNVELAVTLSSARARASGEAAPTCPI
jgi:hypothetical protein